MSIIGDIPAVPPLPGANSTASSGGAQAKAEQDARWIGDFTDDLSVAIALRNWASALELVEQGTLIIWLHITVWSNRFSFRQTATGCYASIRA